MFVGKNMNRKIGRLAKDNDLGGLFPWTLNYDSFENNNTLVDWLVMDL
jgi:GH18 family chitinase